MADAFRSFMADYAAAIDRFDAAAAAGHFHCPCLLLNGDGAVALTDRTAIEANMRALLEDHRRLGFARARVLALRSERLADRLAIAHVRWRVEGEDGTALGEWSNSYDLLETGEGWRIVVSTTHDADV